MHSVIVEPAAEQDLDEMWESKEPDAEDAVALIEAALEEIAYDEEFLSRMWRRREMRHSEPTVEADRIVVQWHRGRNLHRLKIWDFPENGGGLIGWRVVYAYDGRCDSYHILGIIRRDINYDEQHPHFQRIVKDYDALGIPSY
ncbi:hypothetical protein GCM10009125_00420 [Castellaniella daejeonensis]|uniref:Type II toxin-antitoxin system RelE/ParE family toxin n=1 Tax=Castellaniella daejeonensis TaxID=659013 RepID=A0ABP3CTS5_9BURK